MFAFDPVFSSCDTMSTSITPALNPTPAMHLSRLMGVQILACGSYSPPTIVRNEDLAALGCDPEWIIQRTGIRERRRASPAQATSNLAQEAALACLEKAGVLPSELDLIVLATMSPDSPAPSTACRLQGLIGATCPAMDVSAACAGFMFALVTGMQFVKTGCAKKVLVVGGGNTAVEEALFLTNFASEVTVVHRRDEFKAEKILQHRLHNHPKIKVIWNSALDDVLGTHEPKGVHTARLVNVKTGAKQDLAVDGIFVAIGHKPATELFEGQLPFKNGGYLITEPWSTRTSISGVFAAGDVTDDIYRQAVTAAGMGCMAALEAEKYLHATDSMKQAAE